MAQEDMRDAAFPENLQGYTGIIGGYYGGPNAFNVWSRGDWSAFRKNKKLPIWVGGFDGHDEGHQAVAELQALCVPQGSYTVLDMELRIDKTYVSKFGGILQRHGYKVWVYGSASTVFSNPKLNGYFVADYAGRGPFHYPGARATQYATGEKYDRSAIKWWTRTFGPFWK